MAKKNITTIDQLAEMINEGVKTMASKEDVQALDMKIQALDTKVTEGFERIAHLLLAEQKREIEDLKKRMKRLEDALAV
jgi:PHP family Zn ribbon phosphoesterase